MVNLICGVNGVRTMAVGYTIFVDPDGEQYVFDGRIRGGPQGIRGGDFCRARFLVRNAGCAIITTTAYGVRFVYRPRVVREQVIALLMHRLMDSPGARFAISEVGDKPGEVGDRLVGDRRTVLRHLGALHHQRTGGDRPILVRERSVDDKATKPLIRAALGMWRELGPGLLNVQRDCSETLFSGRTLHVQFAADDRSRVRLLRAGTGYADHISKVFSALSDGTISTMPDVRFHRASVNAYHSVLTRSAPVIEDVDAYVFWPAIGHVRERYQRLMLPVGGRNPGLLSCVIFDRGIDLRGLAA